MSSSSHWRNYINRSVKLARDQTSRILRMSGADAPTRIPRTLFTFNSQEDINGFALGSDSDIGGYSTANLTLNTSPERNRSIAREATGVFWGQMRLDVKPQVASQLRGGYAGFRNKRRPTLFGEEHDDLSDHRYLVLRVRASGEPQTRKSYYVNMQTAGSVTTDIWQHRLHFRKSEEWEDVYIPISDFVRTNRGHLAERHIAMWTERVRSVGVSILGGNTGVSGDYELGIDSIRLVNEEDVSRDDVPSFKTEHPL